MQFPYQRVPGADPKAPWVPMPLLKVRLSHNDKHINVNALVDSGAASSLFHSSIAEALGLDLTSGIKQEFFGISGHAVEAYFHLVKFQIVGSTDEHEIAIGFTDSDGVGALLGQSDFFQRHQIKFERYKEQMEIKAASNRK
jgi:predicted aspartyl protease